MSTLIQMVEQTSRLPDGRPLGLFLNMPEGEYHSVKAFSYSGSKEFAKSPAHFKAYLRKDWEIDPDREKFKAVHLLALEPELHDRIVVREGRWAGALKEEVQALQRKGHIVLKPDDYEDAKLISGEILKHPLAGKILANSQAEVSIFWNDPSGIYCKARIDILFLQDQLILGDLKNFGSLANERILWRQISDNKYHWQMWFYSRALEHVFKRSAENHFWIFVEDKDPHGVKLKVCTDAMLDLAGRKMLPLMEQFAECERDDVWPGYAQGAEEANLPSYDWEIYGNE